jgi:CBS domain-containing protein
LTAVNGADREGDSLRDTGSQRDARNPNVARPIAGAGKRHRAIGTGKAIMNAGELCSRIVVFAERDMDLVEAARLMRDHHVGSLVVVDDTGAGRVPAGILTDRDIAIAVVAKGVAPTTLRVGEVMSGDPVTVREQDDVLDALRAMRAHGVRRVPVIDAKGLLAGILALDDVLEVVAEELGELALAHARP